MRNVNCHLFAQAEALRVRIVVPCLFLDARRMNLKVAFVLILLPCAALIFCSGVNHSQELLAHCAVAGATDEPQDASAFCG